jgi:hypothetical protein
MNNLHIYLGQENHFVLNNQLSFLDKKGFGPNVVLF